MKDIRFFAVFFVFLILAACEASEATKNSKIREISLSKKEDLEKNISNISYCISEADRKFPIKVASRKVGPYFSPVNTTCRSYGNSVSCNSTGGFVDEQIKEYDANSEKAENAYASCMKNRGARRERINVCLYANKGEYCYDVVFLSRKKRDTWTGSAKYWSIWVMKRYYEDGFDFNRLHEGVGVILRVK